MSFIFYATNLLLLISFVVFMRQVVAAPEGREDDAGFHFGASATEGAPRRAPAARRVKAVAAFAKVSTRHLAA